MSMLNLDHTSFFDYIKIWFFVTHSFNSHDFYTAKGITFLSIKLKFQKESKAIRSIVVVGFVVNNFSEIWVAALTKKVTRDAFKV